MPLMSLGMFNFQLDTVPFEDLSRKMSWRFGRTERQGTFAAAQFLGPGEDSISISGMLAPPTIGKYAQLETLIEMADQGEAQSLVDGNGNVWGFFTIESVDRKQNHFLDNGVPRKTDFTIELKRVANERYDQNAALSGR